MNKVIIFYKSYDINSKLFELMRIVSGLGMEFKWDNENSKIEISWEFGQESFVDQLLHRCKDVFPAKKITIETLANKENSCEEIRKVVVSPESTSKVEDTNSDYQNDCKFEEGASDNLQVEKEQSENEEAMEENESLEVTDTAEDAETNMTAEEQTTIVEEATASKNDKEIYEASERHNVETGKQTLEHSSEKSEENGDPISKEKNTEEVGIQKKADLSTEKSENSKTPKEKKDEVKFNEKINKAMDFGEKVALNLTLKETFGEAVRTYLDTQNGSSHDERLFKLCNELKITGDAFEKAISIVSYSKSVEKVYDDVARKMKKNVALVKIEIRKSFDKWIKTNYASIAEKYPMIEVKDFLNIFRSDNQKF